MDDVIDASSRTACAATRFNGEMVNAPFFDVSSRFGGGG
jgi:hypothetical protein